jgi:hypothetical protein
MTTKKRSRRRRDEGAGEEVQELTANFELKIGSAVCICT